MEFFMDAAWWKRVACSGSCPISYKMTSLIIAF